jgi:lipopolysaccharide/colanic/teichoic acid biosynthesis glycosyltransferase
MYQKYFKRLFDIVSSFCAIIILSPVLLIVAVLVRLKLGSPVIFKQKRPGKDEKIFTMYKFRTMTDAKDDNENLLPDSDRLTKFGKLLRSTSLDELPELFNILKGDMSVVGPRPQLVVDMLFMNKFQQKRHVVRPGLTGLAQINGRNNLDWLKKLEMDIIYISKITFVKDIYIILITFYIAFIQRKDIAQNDQATSVNFGDYLLDKKLIDKDMYNDVVKKAHNYLGDIG